MLGQSHVAIVQVVSAMAKAGLLERRQDPEDGRIRMLHLTGEGRAIMERVRGISAQVDRAAAALLDEAAPGFLEQLDALDDALDRSSFAERIVRTTMGKRNEPLSLPCYLPPSRLPRASTSGSRSPRSPMQ